MKSLATVRRKGGETVQDEDSGLDVPVWDVVHSDLSMRLSGAAASTSPYRAVDLDGVTVTVPARILHFPADTTDLADGDMVEITSGENAGAVFRIIEASWQDQATARRVPAIGDQRPLEW